MKRFILSLLCLLTLAAVAQPPARRRAQQAQESQTPQPAAYRDFPTLQTMPADAAWRRDIYRELDLTKDANATLYYPTVPQDGRMNLFTFLFKSMLRGQLKAYDYKLDGNEDFSESNVVKAKEIMDRYHIFYESRDGRIRVSDSDIPSDEVRSYFIKESVYYDQHTATFRSVVTALCPVLKRGDDFGGSDSKYPMFWVKYEDVAPQLAKLVLMSSNLNNAAMMSADDYFTLGRYEGEIYKTTNLQDRVLTNYCTTDTALVAEQQRIERELKDFESHVWGTDTLAVKPDTVAADSAAAAPAPRRRTTSSSTVRRTTPSRRTTATSGSGGPAKKSRPAKTSAKPRTRTSSGSSRAGGGYSVRRERH